MKFNSKSNLQLRKSIYIAVLIVFTILSVILLATHRLLAFFTMALIVWLFTKGMAKWWPVHRTNE